MNVDVLINKDYPLNGEFVPNDLLQIDSNKENFHKYQDSRLTPKISYRIVPYVLFMFNEAKKAGFNIIVDSGYRSFNYQQEIWAKEVEDKGEVEAKKLVAFPGSSEHQSGLAFDIAYLYDGIFDDNVTESDKEVRWLIKNAHKFGFILRYPKGKEEITGFSFEAWHYRFVGVKLATILYNCNLTLEEYYENKEQLISLGKTIEEPNFLTILEFMAGSILVNSEYSFQNLVEVIQNYEQEFNVPVVIPSLDICEELIIGLKSLKRYQLEDIAGKIIIDFIRDYFLKVK